MALARVAAVTVGTVVPCVDHSVGIGIRKGLTYSPSSSRLGVTEETPAAADAAVYGSIDLLPLVVANGDEIDSLRPVATGQALVDEATAGTVVRYAALPLCCRIYLETNLRYV